MKPEVIVFAGPNGSGKSTFTELLKPPVDYINADEIKKNLKCTALEAAKLAEQQREAHVAGLEDFCFETVLSTDRNLKLLQKAAGGDGVSKELMRFFTLVLGEKREKFLQFMTWSYIDLYREDKNILIGELTTAVPSPKLADYLSKTMSKKMNGARIQLETKVDPNLIGGYTIELAGYRLDASVANQLKRVEQQFIAKNRRIV